MERDPFPAPSPVVVATPGIAPGSAAYEAAAVLFRYVATRQNRNARGTAGALLRVRQKLKT